MCMHAPPGQKAQKAAKKKPRQEETGELLLQMQRIADQGERDLEYRLRLREETRLAEQRADDARTMTVDPSIFTPKKRSYWERKQTRIIEREEQGSSAGAFRQPSFSPEATTPHSEDDSNLDLYVPVEDTQWMGRN
ncbi:hypothetical protein ABKV19_003816 [Rosa sericea]